MRCNSEIDIDLCGIQGILHQVDEELLDSLRIGMDIQIIGNVDIQLCIVLEQGFTNEQQGFTDDGQQLTAGFFKILLATEIQQGAHNFLTPFGLAVNLRKP